jgi:F-type H+-transporting ATPase subunit epsilon
MDSFPLEIVTPVRRAFSENAHAIYAPTPRGTVGILPRHQPLFTILSEGEIKIITGNRELFLAIGGGYMQVTPQGVTILVTRAVHADEINEAAIEKARATAKDAIARRVKGEELKNAQAILRRSLIEMKVLRHRRHSSRLQNSRAS